MVSNFDELPGDGGAEKHRGPIGGRHGGVELSEPRDDADRVMESMMSGEWTRAAQPGSATHRPSTVRREPGRHSMPSLGESPGRGLSLGWAVVAGFALAGAIHWLQPRASPHRLAPREPGVGVVAGDAAPAERRTLGHAHNPSAPGPASVATPTSGDAASSRVPPHLAANTDATPGLDSAPSAVVGPTPLPASHPRSTTGAIATTGPAPGPGEPTVPAPAVRGVREPPPGTPPSIASTFARLPVSPADRPPVGGVGASGIHVDRVSTAVTYDKAGCEGVADEFSLAAVDRVNVCLRVVHPRDDETVAVVWQKVDGSSFRRGTVAIKPLHAYRTRAYLILRKEYVGDWKVRILSADGVELAAHEFTITP